jgi:hypothetical protein
MTSELHDFDADEAPQPRRFPIPRSIAGRTACSLAALVALGSIGVVGTQASFADQVTMAQVSVTGGSLDMVANNDTGDAGVAWAGGLSVALTGFQPGDEASGTVEIDNTGDLPFSVTATTVGVDGDSCFSYYFRETAVSGGTGAGAWPVNLAGMGTAAGADATTAAFATPITALDLPDAGADLEWEADDTKVYTLTVRMADACATNGAAGTLDFTFDAAQV